VLIVPWACVQTSHNSIDDNCNDESNDNDVIGIDNDDDNNNNSAENYSWISWMKFIDYFFKEL